jgi:hypothetical protein
MRPGFPPNTIFIFTGNSTDGLEDRFIEQAKRAWFLHGKVLEGSNELWPQDDWDTANQKHEIKFDDVIIGYKLPPMYMSWYENGKYMGAQFTATIVGLKDDGHTAILDKRAPHQAEQWQMQIVPNV